MEGVPFDESLCMTNNNIAKMHRCLESNARGRIVNILGANKLGCAKKLKSMINYNINNNNNNSNNNNSNNNDSNNNN